MKYSIILIFLFNSIVIFSQENNDNKLSKFRYYTVINKDSSYIKKVSLKAGIVKKILAYDKKKSTKEKIRYYYDNEEKLIERKFFLKNLKSKLKKTWVKEKYSYNKDKLIQFENNFGWLTSYSNFNDLEKPQIIEFTTKSSKNYKTIEKISYYDNGFIKQSIKENLIGDNTIGSIIENYKYDDYGNIIELKRQSKHSLFIPNKQYKEEYYKYEYDNNLWITKKMFADGKEIDTWKRTFVKNNY